MTLILLLNLWPIWAGAQTAASARLWLERFGLESDVPAGLLLEVGGSDTPLCTDCVQLDLDPAGAHVRGDARRLPFADRSVALIVAKSFPWNSEFLEYLREDIAAHQERLILDVMSEFDRVLGPGGRALLIAEYEDEADGALADPSIFFARQITEARRRGREVTRLPSVLFARAFDTPSTRSAWPDRVLRSERRMDLRGYLSRLVARDGSEPRVVRGFLQGYCVRAPRPASSPCAFRLAR